MTTRVAIAGFGAWGQMHARAIAAIDNAEVVAIYCHGDTSEAAAIQNMPGARRYRDYDAMLRAGGIDVVNVTVPNHCPRRVHNRGAGSRHPRLLRKTARPDARRMRRRHRGGSTDRKAGRARP